MSIHKLITSFNKYLPLDDPEKEDLKERAIERKIRRRQLILSEDEVCRQIVSSTAEERYLAFLRQYPALSQRLPNTQIASYLGITPEFLSKIRKDLSQRS
ncbi:hypothetical protein ACQ86N_16585 [Puia sp. P3]|uniref:hypothetical protein n=1 Tax=Puia sp. P3 TaxID=3423952 RepID=UPI003D66B5D3